MTFKWKWIPPKSIIHWRSPPRKPTPNHYPADNLALIMFVMLQVLIRANQVITFAAGFQFPHVGAGWSAARSASVWLKPAVPPALPWPIFPRHLKHNILLVTKISTFITSPQSVGHRRLPPSQPHSLSEIDNNEKNTIYSVPFSFWAKFSKSNIAK